MPDWITWLDRELSRPAPAIPSREPRTVRERLQNREHRQAIARQLAQLAPGGQLPAKGTAERRRYETAMRQMQRYVTTAGERRQTKPAFGRIRQASITLDRRTRNMRQLRTSGGTIAGLRAELAVNGYPPRERTFPDFILTAGQWHDVFNAIEAGNEAQAEDLLSQYAGEAKGFFDRRDPRVRSVAVTTITDVIEGSIQ